MGCHTWFENDIRYISQKDLKYLKNACKDYLRTTYHNTYGETFDDFKDCEVQCVEHYIEDFETIVSEYLKKRVLWYSDPLRRGWKKSEWKREQRNLYRLYRRKKLRKGELLGLLRSYGRIQEHKHNQEGNEWMWNNSAFGCDWFRISDYDKAFYSFKEFEQYINENPTAVYKVVRDGDVMVNIDHIKLSHDMVREQWELNMIALYHAKRFFNEYPHGRIMLG